MCSREISWFWRAVSRLLAVKKVFVKNFVSFQLSWISGNKISVSNFWKIAEISTIGFLGSKYDFFSHIWHYYGKEILPVKSVHTVRALESAGDVYFRCIDISRRFEHLESREISNTKHDLFRRNTGCWNFVIPRNHLSIIPFPLLQPIPFCKVVTSKVHET